MAGRIVHEVVKRTVVYLLLSFIVGCVLGISDPKGGSCKILVE